MLSISQSHPQQPPNPWNREQQHKEQLPITQEQLRREEQLRWDQKQLERDQKQLEQLRREKEQLRREEQLQRDQEQFGGGDVWGGERLLRIKAGVRRVINFINARKERYTTRVSILTI